VRLGAHSVRAIARGRARSGWVRTEVTAAGAGNQLELRMQQAFSLSGRVDTSSFEPLPDDKKEHYWTGFTLIQREAGSAAQRDSISIWTDQDGKFKSEEGAFPGTYVAQSQRSDGTYESVHPIVVGPQDLTDLVLSFRKVRSADPPRAPRATK
jgi:hypothetical protein